MADATSNPAELPAESTDQPSTEEVTTQEEQSQGTDQAAAATETEASDESTQVGGESTDEQAKGMDTEEEGTFFDPKKVPPELMPAYKQMQAAFTQKTQAIAAREIELAQQGATKEEAAAQAQAEAKTSIVDDVLRAEGIDPAKLPADQRQALDLVAKIAQQAASGKVNEAVAPIYQKETLAQVQSFFKANPEAVKYSRQMAEIDRRTGGTLELPELYALASREDTKTSAKEELSKKATDKRLKNSESSASTASGTAKGNDPFKDMLGQSSGMPWNT